jgi:hypothetical protein
VEICHGIFANKMKNIMGIRCGDVCAIFLYTAKNITNEVDG